MPTDPPFAQRPVREAEQDKASQKRPLPPAAERALAEAAARRAQNERKGAESPAEVGGRGGPDPTRYGDWEINGLSSDF